MFKHILLPVDGSELSHMAVSAAIQFARTAAARLTPYMCVETYRSVRLAHSCSSRNKADFLFRRGRFHSGLTNRASAFLSTD